MGHKSVFLNCVIWWGHIFFFAAHLENKEKLTVILKLLGHCNFVILMKPMAKYKVISMFKYN